MGPAEVGAIVIAAITLLGGIVALATYIVQKINTITIKIDRIDNKADSISAVAKKSLRQSTVNSVFLLRRGHVEARHMGMILEDGTIPEDIKAMYQPIFLDLHAACVDGPWKNMTGAEIFIEIEDRWGASFMIPNICERLGVHQNACIAVALKLVRPDLLPPAVILTISYLGLVISL